MVRNGQLGFSTVEILIATSILVVVFAAVILLVLGGQKNGFEYADISWGTAIERKNIGNCSAEFYNKFQWQRCHSVRG